MKRCAVYATQHSVVVVGFDSTMGMLLQHGCIVTRAMQVFIIIVIIIINTCHTSSALHLSKSVNPPHINQPGVQCMPRNILLLLV